MYSSEVKVDLIIQARMGSKRLPGKSLFKLAGEPLVGRILERVKRCEMIDDIVLAIPDTSENIPLIELAKRYSVKFYAGSENDLVERYFQASSKINSDYICRLPADNPTPEPKEIDKMIEFHLKLDKKGFSSNLAEIRNSGYPDGIGIEIFSYELLTQIRNKNKDPHMREHLHLNFFNYSTGIAVDESWCPINTMKCPKEFARPDLVLDVNTIEEFLFMEKLYEYIYPKNCQFTILDIIDWYDNEYKKNND